MSEKLCRYCKEVAPCDNGCEELALIYRSEQREKMRDIELTDAEIDALRYGEW